MPLISRKFLGMTRQLIGQDVPVPSD